MNNTVTSRKLAGLKRPVACKTAVVKISVRRPKAGLQAPAETTQEEIVASGNKSRGSPWPEAPAEVGPPLAFRDVLRGVSLKRDQYEEGSYRVPIRRESPEQAILETLIDAGQNP
jgi:hypothetical protein